MSKAAKRPELEALHDTLAKELAAAVKETEVKVIDVPDVDEEGKVVGTKPMIVRTRNAAILNAARQFLKDNNVECAPGYPSEGVKSVQKGVETLPFPDHPGGPDDERTLN